LIKLEKVVKERVEIMNLKNQEKLNSGYHITIKKGIRKIILVKKRKLIIKEKKALLNKRKRKKKVVL